MVLRKSEKCPTLVYVALLGSTCSYVNPACSIVQNIVHVSNLIPQNVMTCFDFFGCNWRACYLLCILHNFSSAFGVWQAFCFWNALKCFWFSPWYRWIRITYHMRKKKEKKKDFLLPQANGHTCVDFECPHPIDVLFWSLTIYLLGFFSKHECG
jgi:hypothetical protein